MQIKKIALIVMIFSLLAAVTAAPGNAETISAGRMETVAVVLVIDTSGSMKTTDPQNLRSTAANIFIDLLSPEDYLGIIAFSTSAEVVSSMGKIKDSDHKKSIKEKLSQKVIATGDTNYLVALSEAEKQLSALDEPNMRKGIVFLTDGTPDPDPRKSADPAFMNEYMTALWKTVSGLAQKKYAVYSVGFGETINPQILRKISEDTQGEFRGMNDSAELAAGFFQILSELKNRNGFLDAPWNVNRDNKFDFVFDEFTSQVTFVFTYSEKTPFEAVLTPPRTNVTPAGILINKTSQYTIITLNQNGKELTGNWSLNSRGTGTVKAFGAKDSFVKAWLKKPTEHSVHSLKEPLALEAAITGSKGEKLSVEAQIIKNGVREAFPVLLKYHDGSYQGVYAKTDQPGTYELELKVYQGNQQIAGTVSKIYVKRIPVLSTDFYPENENYILGSSTSVTSWLNLNGNFIKPSNDLKIESYQLVFDFGDDREEILQLYDNGKRENGDILLKDGIYSSKVRYNREGDAKAVLMARGVYMGESFLLEKALGTFHVYPPGTVRIKTDMTGLYGKRGEQIEIPVSIMNTSQFPETINMSSAEKFGMFPDGQITAAPNDTTETTLMLQLNQNLSDGVQVIPVTFTTEEPLTKLEPKRTEVHVEVVSGFHWVVKRISEYLMLFELLLFVISLFFLIGILLYQTRVYPKTIVQGVLMIYENGNTENPVKVLKLNSLRKSTVVISINDLKITSEQLPGRYQYKIILNNQYETGRWKLTEGYRSLGKQERAPRLQIKTTEPGVFLYRGIAYTNKELTHGDVFETGGYTFRYLQDQRKSEYLFEKDLLEGKV